MDVLTESQRRGLAFISAANLGGYEPTLREIELWLDRPTPKRIGGILEAPEWLDEVLSHSSEMLNGVPETTVEHLLQVAWIKGSGGGRYKLTSLGRALLTAAEAEEEGHAEVVVLHHENPLAYSSLIGHLSDVGDATIVDPYLDLQAILDLSQHTGVRRAIVGDAPRYRPRRTQMAIYLESASSVDMEVRYTGELHDRMVVAEDGRVWTLGMSLNGIQRRKSVTVLTPMPDAAALTLSTDARAWWDQAQPILDEKQVEEDDQQTR